jgi:hypothetical protein
MKGRDFTRSDLLVINTTDLPPHVGVSLEVMERDALSMRGSRPFVFNDLKSGVGAEDVLSWLRTQMATPPDSCRTVIDVHAPYKGRTHMHPHTLNSSRTEPEAGDARMP